MVEGDAVTKIEVFQKILDGSKEIKHALMGKQVLCVKCSQVRAPDLAEEKEWEGIPFFVDHFGIFPVFREVGSTPPFALAKKIVVGFAEV
jgi:hypothetical protein